MTTDFDQVRLRMVAADPAPREADPPAEVMTAGVLLDLIDERSGTVPTSTDTLRIDTRFEPPRRKWNPGWAFAGAFVLLIVAIGVATALVGNEAGEVVDRPAPTTVAPSPTTAAEQPPAATSAAPVTSTPGPTTTTIPKVIPTDITWEIAMPMGVDGIQFTDVLSDGTSVVATGFAFAGRGWEAWRSEVWRSEDGLNWEPFPNSKYVDTGIPVMGPNGFTTLVNEDSTIEYGHHEMIDAVRGASGWIGVGVWELDGRIWISPDGTSWQRLDDTLFSGTRLNAIAAGGPGYVAVGQFHGIPDGDVRAAVFVSSSGLDWQLVDVFADRESNLGSIHVDPADGSLLAFGNRAVWRSQTGLDWTPIHQRSALTWLSQPPPWADVVWVGDIIVAAGGDHALSLWYSYDDGATWLRHDPEDQVFAGDVGINALVEHRGKIVAVGGCNRCTTNLMPDEVPRFDPEWPVIWVGTPQTGG